MAVVVTASWLQPYSLHLNLPEGQKATSSVYVELADLQLGGMPMGVSGNAHANLVCEVTGGDEDKKQTEVNLSFEDVKAFFNDAEQAPPQMPPLVVTADEHGRVVEYGGASTESALDILASGGAPLQLLVTAMALPQLPTKPVNVGDEWEEVITQPTPFGVDAETTYEGKLVEVADGRAKLEYQVTGDLPAFQAPNPLQPGMDMTVADGKIRFVNLVQLIDLDTGAIVESSGRIIVSFNALMEGWEQPMPAALTVDFASAPDEERVEALFKEHLALVEAGGQTTATQTGQANQEGKAEQPEQEGQ
ncbi:MAG: hypothetical protein J7M15_06625 [Anaerolineae bacterium]|nr:hypothetical protein [Anaerolineae bacterium]